MDPVSDDLDAAYRAIFKDHPEDWITWQQAVELVGCPISTIDWHTRTGRIEKRPWLNQRPSLKRSSVEDFAEWWRTEQHERASRRRKPTQHRLKAKAGFVTLQQAAARLEVTSHHVPYLIETGKLVGERDGGRWWVQVESLEQHAAEREQWISQATAQQLTGIAATTIADAAAAGRIERRKVDRSLPSLDRAGVVAWAETYRQGQQARRDALAQAAAARPVPGGPPQDGQEWLDTHAAAAAMGIKVRRLRNLISAGEALATRRGGRWWLRRNHVEQVSGAAATLQAKGVLT